MTMERKPKKIFQLDTPYTEVQWPLISSKNQEHIFEVLIRLLSPLGNHRTTYSCSSKGKRSAKRIKKNKRKNGINVEIPESNAIPPPPEISSHVLIGLASITRHLEASSNRLATEGLLKSDETGQGIANSESGMDGDTDGKHQFPHLGAIFVCRSSQPSVLHAHLPQLVATASLRNPQLQPIRLVQLPSGSEKRLSLALGLPRASSIAVLEGAPYSKHLLDLVQELVPVIEVSWLEQARKAQYLPVKINTILTTTPIGKNKPEKT